MIVVDASVVVNALLHQGELGIASRERLRGEDLIAPAIIDLEFGSALRGLLLGRKLTSHQGQEALADFTRLALSRGNTVHLLARCLELRENLTVYDACYAALAEYLGVTLLTSDLRLATSPGLRCRVERLS